jgi:hypothetical protein
MESNTCPTCRAAIPAHAPGGFCLSCLLRDAEEPPTPGQGVPPLEAIAAAFPQREVLGLIGQSGMGFVYKIRQPSLDRTVAMKILSPGTRPRSGLRRALRPRGEDLGETPSSEHRRRSAA